MGGEQKTVVDVKPLGVGFTFGPWLDMTGAQEAWLGNTGHGASSFPIGQQSFSKHILPDTLDDQSFSFGRAWQGARLRFEYP